MMKELVLGAVKGRIYPEQIADSLTDEYGDDYVNVLMGDSSIRKGLYYISNYNNNDDVWLYYYDVEPYVEPYYKAIECFKAAVNSSGGDILRQIVSHYILGMSYKDYDFWKIKGIEELKTSTNIWYQNKEKIEGAWIEDTLRYIASMTGRASAYQMARLSKDPHEKIRYYEMVREWLDLDCSEYQKVIYFYLDIDDMVGAKKTAKDGLRKYPGDPNLLMSYALAFDDTDPERLTIINKILENEKTDTTNSFDYSKAYDCIARTYCRTGRYAKGLSYAKKAVSMVPGNDLYWETKGMLNYYLGNYAECVDDMTAALECAIAENANVLAFRGKAYIELGEVEKGNQDLEEAKRIGEDNTTEIWE